jgi:hypothetical protein
MYFCPECSFKWNVEVSREKVREEVEAKFAKSLPYGSKQLDGASCALMNELKQNDASILVQEHTALPRLWGDQFDYACGMDVSGAADQSPEPV